MAQAFGRGRLYNVGSGRPLLRSLRSENRRCSKASEVMLLGFIYYISAGLAPSLVCSVPPHLRACPGPLTKDPRECKASGTATLSALPFRSRNGVMSSNCDVVDGILQCIVQLSVGSVIIPVHRHGGFAGEGSVSYATFPGSAKSNLHFHASSGVISWAPLRGEPQVIEIALIDTGIYRPGNYRTSFSLKIEPANGTSRLSAGPVSEASITIINTNARTGSISMQQESVMVNENEGAVLLNVTRKYGADCEALVKYRTVAIQGSDFGHYGVDLPFQEGSVVWGEGDDSIKTISLPIIDDDVIQKGRDTNNVEAFYVEIYDAGCASLGELLTLRTRVEIQDDDTVGSLVVERQTLMVHSTDGHVDVGVRRVSGSGPVSLNYHVLPGSAIAGRDFLETSGELVWQGVELGRRCLRIALLNNASRTAERRIPHKTLLVRFSYKHGILIDSNEVLVTVLNAYAMAGKVGFANMSQCQLAAPELTSQLCAIHLVQCLHLCPMHGEGETADLALRRTEGYAGAVSVKYEVHHVMHTRKRRTWIDCVPWVQTTAGKHDERCIHDLGPSFRHVAQETAGCRQGFGKGVCEEEEEGEKGGMRMSMELNLTGTVTWPDGDASQKYIRIPLALDGGTRRMLQYLRVTISDAHGNQDARTVDGDRNTAYITILDQYTGASFSIEPSQDSFVESDGYGKVMVHRHGQPFGQATVSFETLDGDAVGGLDFVGTGGRLTWEHGDTASKVVAVPLVNDATSRYGLHFKHFFVRLVQNTSNTVLDDHGMIAAVHIIDDSAETGFASFAPAVAKPGEENRQERPTRQDVKVHDNMLHNVLEGLDRQINLTVMRIGGNQGNMSVRYRTVGMTAVVGEHFKDAHGILTWLEGDKTNRSISLDILDDDHASPSIHHRAFRVVIEHVTFSNGLRSTQIFKGPSVFAEVWIGEDDGSGVLSMQHPTLSVTESAGVVNLTVLRSGGSSGAVAVKVRAESASASRGSASRMLPGASLPTSCREAQHKVGHVAAIEVLAGQAREVYCNAREEDESSSASSSASFDESSSGSIFLWDYSTRLWDRNCIEIPEIGWFGNAAKAGQGGRPWVHPYPHSISPHLYPHSISPRLLTISAQTTKSGGYDYSLASFVTRTAGNAAQQKSRCNASNLMDLPGASLTDLTQVCKVYSFGELGLLSCLDSQPLTHAHQLYVITDGKVSSSEAKPLLIPSERWCPPNPHVDFSGATATSDTGTSDTPGPCPAGSIDMMPSYMDGGRRRSWAGDGGGAHTLIAGANGFVVAGGSEDGPGEGPEYWSDEKSSSRSRSSKSASCRPCPRAFFAPVGSSRCVACPPGMTSEPGSTSCIDRIPQARVFWTVNGRVMYRECGQEGTLKMILGGSLHDPMSRSQAYVFETCPSSLFAECSMTGALGRDPRQSDLFAHVDASGFLYFMDGGGKDALFGCDQLFGVEHYGLVRTSIEVGPKVSNDYELAEANELRWESGDSAPKNISIFITKDATVDSAVWEEFSVFLYDASVAAIDPLRHTVRVRIHDDDGPGYLMLSLNGSSAVGSAVEGDGAVAYTAHHLRPQPLAERGLCCGGNCDEAASNPERVTWCVLATVERSSARGAVCASVATLGRDVHRQNGLSALAGKHFLELNATVCWSHGDASPRLVSVILPYHPVYDEAHKTLNLSLGALSNPRLAGVNLNGTAYANFLLGQPLQITIEDQDMEPGVISMDVNKVTGQNVFYFTVHAHVDTALVPVLRIGATDTDISVSYTTTAWPTVERMQMKMPILIASADSGAGANLRCNWESETASHICAERQSAAQCVHGICAVTQTVEVNKACVSGSRSFLHADGDYMRTSGELRWKEGESGVKNIAIPLFHDSIQASARDTGAASATNLYRTFRVELRDAKAEYRGHDIHHTDLRKRLLANMDEYRAVKDCLAETCLESKQLLARCGANACTHALSSEAVVVLSHFMGPGHIRLVNTSYFVPEDTPGGRIHMTVQRVSGSSGNISVRFSTVSRQIVHVSEAAEAGVDYKHVSGSLTWVDGDISDKIIAVSIINDEVHTQGRRKKSFDLVLSEPIGGARMLQSSASIVIVDDDDPARLEPDNHHPSRLQHPEQRKSTMWTLMTRQENAQNKENRQKIGLKHIVDEL